jgi:hypothetical protein
VTQIPEIGAGSTLFFVNVAGLRFGFVKLIFHPPLRIFKIKKASV